MSLSQDQFRLTTVCAGINTYANAKGLDHTLSSLRELDKVFVIHGRYPSFVYEDPNSLFDTQQVCSKYPNTVLVNLDAATEIDKRNRYLQEAEKEDYDFLLVIDDDEYIHPELADWSLFRENLRRALIEREGFQIFDVYFGGSSAQSGARPRLFYKPATIRYWQKHYWFLLLEKEGLPLLKGCSDSGHMVKGITILHDQTRHTEHYNKARKDYGTWLHYHENAVAVTI